MLFVRGPGWGRDKLVARLGGVSPRSIFPRGKSPKPLLHISLAIISMSMVDMEQATGGYRPRISDSALAGAALSDDFIQGFKQSLLNDYQKLVTRSDFTFYSLSTSSLPLSQPRYDADSTTNDSPTTGGGSSIGAQGSTMGCSDIAYPLSLFDCFPELPSTDTMDGLSRIFRDVFLKNTPFLSHLSEDSLLKSTSGNPPYLIFSKTLLATLSSESYDRRRWAFNLYISGVKTFVGAVELDNRTSRNHLWYQAVSCVH